MNKWKQTNVPCEMCGSYYTTNGKCNVCAKTNTANGAKNDKGESKKYIKGIDK